MSIDALLILESWELDQWQLEPCKFDISACGICQQVAMNLYFFMVGCWTNNYLFIAFEFFSIIVTVVAKPTGAKMLIQKPLFLHSGSPEGLHNCSMSCNQVHLVWHVMNNMFFDIQWMCSLKLWWYLPSWM